MSALHQQNLELHQAIVDLETRLRADTTGIETQLRSEMADTESRLRAEIADFRAEFNELRSETNATLLEHTAQLARLETALGLKPSQVSSAAAAALGSLPFEGSRSASRMPIRAATVSAASVRGSP